MVGNGEVLKMRIATYNIWESDRGMPERYVTLVDTIRAVNADILCLQELSDYETFDGLSVLCGYEGGHWNSEYGVGIFTNHTVTRIGKMEYGICANIDVNGTNVFIINLHLPWRSALKREELIVDMIESAKRFGGDYSFVVGDFNCSVNSSVHRYLKGDQSLLGSDAYFVDLAEAYAEIIGAVPKATLNVRENPRYKDACGNSTNTIEINQRYDRILMENPFPKAYPILKRCDIFGTEIFEATGLCPSDHYGVFADLEIGS